MKKSFAALTLLAAFFAGCSKEQTDQAKQNATAAAEKTKEVAVATGAAVSDGWITTKVKAKFAEDPTVSAMAIKVDTMKGVVQLSGFAKSGEERMMAERLARNINGVADVRNDIIVK